MNLSEPGAQASVVLGLFGLLAGSFANVAIYRVPEGKPLGKERSACPACGHLVRAWDNIPLVSWALLRGRCRDCRSPISPRYPLVEALVGVLFALIGLRFGVTSTGVGEAVLAAGLVILAFIDLDRMLLPKKIVYATLVLVAAVFLGSAAVGSTWHKLLVAVLCGAVPWAFFFAINYVSPKALGFGDVRLALLMGFGLGWLGTLYALLGFIVAAVLGSVVGVTLMAMRKAGRKTPVPFGTFLASGAMLAVLAGAPVVTWYSALLHR